jgi:CBS domain-containing protein
VLIVEGQALIGIFSERDALLKINDKFQELSAHPISEFMTPNPGTVKLGTKIAFAVQLMDLGGYRHVPVLDADARPVGIISARDILNYLTEKMSPSAA